MIETISDFLLELFWPVDSISAIILKSWSRMIFVLFYIICNFFPLDDDEESIEHYRTPFLVTLIYYYTELLPGYGSHDL